MFVPDFKDSIPGYTGHKRHNLETGAGPDLQQKKDPSKQIPGKPIENDLILLGYCGYIPGVKSENVFGETFGKTTYASSAQNFHRGLEEPAHIKYTSMMKGEFIDHATKRDKIQTTAQIVGVHREEASFKRVSSFI